MTKNFLKRYFVQFLKVSEDFVKLFRSADFYSSKTKFLSFYRPVPQTKKKIALHYLELKTMREGNTAWSHVTFYFGCANAG